MADTYFSLTLDLPEQEADLAQSLLEDLGALGLEVRDREAPPMPGVRGPAAGEAIVVGFFDQREGAESARAEVAAAHPAARIQLDEVKNQDWSESWKALIRSVEVGRLWVGPPWEAERAPADKVRLVIEPKMAFGTGDHPTTSLCLRAVDEHFQQHPGDTMLDVGTGTGVLAIAARKLGAARAVGIDNDPMSVVLAQENATVNGTPDVVLSGDTLDRVGGPYGLVVANILANTLIELAPLIAPKVGRRLVLAGVLAHQREEVEAAYLRQGLKPLGVERIDDWIRLDFVR